MCSADCRRKWAVAVVGLSGIVLRADEVRGDPSAQIAQIERMDRVERLKAYEQAADRRAISETDRVQLIQSFAGHVKKLSPVYMLIDWEWLGGNVQNGEVHEMGHCFGLGHTGVPGAGMHTSTNIMASIGEEFGSGGKRDLGFSEAQTAVIVYHAKRSIARLGLNE